MTIKKKRGPKKGVKRAPHYRIHPELFVIVARCRRQFDESAAMHFAFEELIDYLKMWDDQGITKDLFLPGWGSQY